MRLLTRMITTGCLALCVALSTATLTAAGIVERSDDGLYEVLTSDLDVLIDDWDDLRKSVMDAYGLTVLETMDPQKFEKFGKAGNPPAYTMKQNNFEAVIIEMKLRDPSLLGKLTGPFSDLTTAQAAGFTDGLRVEVQDAMNGKHDLIVELYRRVVDSDVDSFAVDTPYAVRFPKGTSILTQQGGENGTPAVYYLQVPLGQSDIIAQIASQLANTDAQVEQFKREGADVVIARSAKGDLIVQALDDTGGNASTVHLVIIQN